jgi:hypothetical protein
MSRKRPRVELDAGATTGGGLFDFLPPPADNDEVAVVEKKVETEAPPKEDKSKVIFLDIDGVLRKESETERVLVDGELVPVLPTSEEAEFNKLSFMALRMIVQRTGASIVLSSEWRRTEVMRNAIGKALRSYGLPQIRACTGTFVKMKPELVKASNTIAFAERRAREIGEWLKQQPDVKAWVALDDVDLSWGDGARSKGTPIMRSRVVKVNAELCLSDKNARDAIDILCNPPMLTPEEEAGIEKRATRKLQAVYPFLKNSEKVQEISSGLPRPIPKRQGF